MTTANIITLIRIILVPVFLVIYLLQGPYYETISLVIFLIASLTDKLDGYIARKNNEVTVFGQFIDPLADKLLVCAALLVLTQAGIIPSWCVFIILAREFIITALRAVAISAGRVIAASNIGKAKMVIQVIAISFLLTPLRDLSIGIMTIATLMIAIMTIFSAISGVDYLYKNRDVILSSK